MQRDVQVRKIVRVARVTAATDDLTLVYTLVECNCRAVVSQVGIEGECAVVVADDYEIVEPRFGNLAIAMRCFDMHDDSSTNRNEGRADWHVEVVSVLFRAAVTIKRRRAVALSDAVAHAHGIRQNPS